MNGASNERASAAPRFRVDPGWRRTDHGFAARLDTRTTIEVADPVGRWREVDPRRAQDGWRSVGKVLGLGAWATVVGLGWWAGSKRGAGPLGVLQRG